MLQFLTIQNKLLVKGKKEIVLIIDETKTKLWYKPFKSRGLQIRKVKNFKYQVDSSANINKNVNGHKEIKKQLTYQERQNITFYKILSKPVGLYICDTYATTKSDERNLKGFDKNIWRKIFGLKKNNKGVDETKNQKTSMIKQLFLEHLQV